MYSSLLTMIAWISAMQQPKNCQICAFFHYLFSATLSNSLLRYMKHSFGGRKIMNRDVWFFVHQTHTILCVLCTLAAFIVISVEKGVLEYSPSYIANINPHPAIGFTVLLLSFLQPTMALFRPGAKNERY